MRMWLLIAFVLLVSGVPIQARTSVSPVVIEASGALEGDRFEIICQHQGEFPQQIRLDLALFDQDQRGCVYFLEDPESVQKARRFLELEQEEIILIPGERKTVGIRLRSANFDHLYAALFVRSNGYSVATRLVVLFLLSTSETSEQIDISSWQCAESKVKLVISNDGLRHSLWEGELLCFDSAGELGATMPLKSGLVLAGRSRDLLVDLPGWVKRVEISAQTAP